MCAAVFSCRAIYDVLTLLNQSHLTDVISIMNSIIILRYLNWFEHAEIKNDIQNRFKESEKLNMFGIIISLHKLKCFYEYVVVGIIQY